MGLISWLKELVLAETKGGLTIFQQQAILSVAAFVRRKEEAYPVALADHLGEVRGKRVAIPRVWEVLSGLEREGYLTSFLVPGGAERDYKPKRLFALLPKGEKMVELLQKGDQDG